MKIQGVNITGGIRLDPPVAPTPTGPSKFVVGAHGNDDAGDASGSAYVYNLDGTGEVKITPSDAADNERFGHAVAIQGDKIIVGTPQTGNGAVYVYNTDGSGEQKISAPAGVVGTNGISFGLSVATK